MKNVPTLIILMLVALAGCRHEEEVVPEAAFEINALSIQSLAQGTYPTFWNLTFENNSTDGVSFAWDFGNGNQSTEEDPRYYYENSGTYTVTLTVESMSGVKRSVSKEIKVVDRVLKQVTITALHPYMLELPNVDTTTTLNVLISIEQFKTLEGNPANRIIYQSDTINMAANETPYPIKVAEKVVIDHGLVGTGLLSFNIYCLFDKTTYILGSSQFSGSLSQLVIENRDYTLSAGLVGGNLVFECNYE